jgi:hypothetical protein
LGRGLERGDDDQHDDDRLADKDLGRGHERAFRGPELSFRRR